MAKYKWRSPRTLEVKINDYFAHCEENKRIPTVPGLTRWLGFNDRRTLLDYKGRESFAPIIKNGLIRIEEALAQRLCVGGPSTVGTLFALKNWFGYRDMRDVEVTQHYDKAVKDIRHGPRARAKSADLNKKIVNLDEHRS